MWRWAAIWLFLACPVWAAPIGAIVETTGSPGTIQRSQSLLEGTLHTPLESMDVVVTGSGTVRLRFVDNTKISVTEQSRLVIDDYVYDPRQGDNSRLAMRVGMGTVRYASGQIARINQQRVDLATPTATIAVRGTDFFMTVAETGESFVVLVPSCDGAGNCRTGRIQVSNDGGMVELNEPFTATSVASRSQSPSPPVRIQLSESNINNLMIVSPPPGLKSAGIASRTAKDDGAQTFEMSTSRAARQAQDARQEENSSVAIIRDTASTAHKDSTPIVVENSISGGVTASRSSPGSGQAFVRFLDGSTGTVTISHQGDNATTQVGIIGSNTFVIRQSQ